MLPVLYIFAKMLSKKSKYAAISAVLFAVDFMHFAQTRIGYDRQLQHPVDHADVPVYVSVYAEQFQQTENFEKR